MPLIPFTVAWLIGIWGASRIALPDVVLGFAAGVAIVGIILSWRAPKPRWVLVLALTAILGALRFNLAHLTWTKQRLPRTTISKSPSSLKVSSSPQASLLMGILLGDDSGIPKSVQAAFRTTGTSHIVAFSG
jgi:predicted membrane metal-binding protein